MMIPAVLAVLVLAAPVQDVQNASSSTGTSTTVTPSQPDDSQRRAQTERSERATGDRPHTVGFGGQIGVSNRGAGAGTRLFFGDKLGVNLNAFWARGNTRYTTTGTQQGSTVGAFPSFIYMLTKPNKDRDIDIRPYVGGGFSYVSAPGRISTTPGGISEQRTSGFGQQIFGGVEVTFKEADWMTISAEEIYYRLPVRFLNTSVIDGFNYVVGVHFYLK